MSLRGRLLVLMTLLNLVVLGVISVVNVVVQERWRERLESAYTALFRNKYDNILPAGTQVERNAERVIDTVRGILRLPLQDQYRDVLIRSATLSGAIDLNPFGSAHRDPRTFPQEAIRAGIDEAMRTGTALQVAGGRCVAITSPDGVVEGGVWFVPNQPSLPEVSFLPYAIGLLVVSAGLFAVFAGWVVNSTLVPPLRRLGAAAHRVESGDYSARVPAMSARELAMVGEAFNAMAEKVQGHTAELEREVRRATEEAAAKERALVQSARLASMGTLAAGIAHEINNPIGGMLNAVNRLAQGEHLSERERTYLELVQKGLERVARTSRKLLDFSPKVLDVVEFQLRDAVEGARALVEHELARQRIRLDVNIEAGLPTLLGEPHEIQQVMLNLFLNALNAMREGAGSRIEVRGERRGDRVDITVRDDGPGVDGATLEQVMNPFFSSSNRPDSTGLGLFISFTIIANHGGEMAVRSAPGEGFEVAITLPIAARREPA